MDIYLILNALISADNDTRKAAEVELENAKETNGSWVMHALCHVVSHDAPNEVHAMALTILRRMFALKCKIYDVEPPEAQTQIKNAMIQAFATISLGNQRNNVAGCVAACAAKINSLNKTWNDLWSNLLLTIQNPEAHPLLRAGSCEVLASCAPYLEKYLRNHHMELSSGLSSCLLSSTDKLKQSASYALAELINSIPSKHLTPFANIPQHILKSVEDSLNTKDSNTAVILLSNTCELVEQSPALFKASAEAFLHACMQIASHHEVSEEVRHIAVEVLLVMCKHNSKIVKKVDGFVNAFFDLLFSYTLNPPVDENWDHSDDIDSNDAEGNSDFDIGVIGMDRLCCAIGSKTQLAPHVMEVINRNKQSASWNERQSAVSALTYCSEGLKYEILKFLEPAVDMLITLFNDENKVVRYTVYQCLSQMATDFAPDFQKQLHAKVMPVLVNGLNDPIPRIVASAASGINNFFDEVDEIEENETPMVTLLSPYVPVICAKLSEIIGETPHMFIRSNSLAAMSSVISTGKFSLIPLVNDLVPVFQKVLALSDANYPEEERHTVRMVKCRAVECTTLLAGVAKFENFQQYAHPMCQYLCQLLSENMPTDDPRLPYVLRGWTNMLDCMGEHVLPYLATLMPPLLNLAGLDCDFKMTPKEVGDDLDDEQGEVEEEEGIETSVLNIRGHGEVYIKVKTSLIEDKTTALQILSEITKNLKEKLGVFVPQVTDIAVNALKFCADANVRVVGAEILQRLIPSYATVPAEVPAFTAGVVTALLNAISTEYEYSQIENYYEVISALASANGQFFTDEMLSMYAKVTTEVCTDSLKRKAEKEEEKRNNESDSDEEIDAEIEEENDILGSCNVGVDNIMKSCPNFVPFFQKELLPLALKCIHMEDATTVVFGLGLLSGYCEFSTDNAASNCLNDIVPPLMLYTEHRDSDVVHSAFNGLRAVILLTAREFSVSPNENAVDFARTVVSKVLNLFKVNVPQKGGVICNALSAGLAALEHFNAQILPNDQVNLINVIISRLPMSDDDEEEAKSVHRRMLAALQHPVVAASPLLRDSIIQRIKSASPDTLDANTVELLKTL